MGKGQRFDDKKVGDSDSVFATQHARSDLFVNGPRRWLLSYTIAGALSYPRKCAPLAPEALPDCRPSWEGVP